MKRLYSISFILFLSILLSGRMAAQENDVLTNAGDTPRVVCYTRTEIPQKLGNALHLGYSEDGRHYMALNNDACVMALRKVDKEPVLSEEEKIPGVMKTLTAPYLFRMKEGGFGVVALRTDKDGIPDATAVGAFLLVKSRDLVDYEPEQLCRLPVRETLEAVSCEYDEAVKKYRVQWMIKGKAFQSHTADFLRFTPIKAAPKLGGVQEKIAGDWHNFRNARFGNSLALTVAEGKYLKNKLGRISNVSVLPLEMSVPASPSVVSDIRKKQATLLYSDGSQAEKRVIWNEEDLKRLASATPGTYTVRGKIFQYSFNYPVSMSNRADPNILYYQGKYYMVSTYDVEWNRIPIHCSATLDGLTDANYRGKEVILVQGEGPHWAPELHVIGSRLYMLLAIIRGEKGVQAYMMQLKENGNPMKPEDWSVPIRVVKSDGNPIYNDGRVDGLSLDMTYFEDGGKSYVCWSDRKKFFVNGKDVDPGPVLCIATVNPKEPWKLTSAPFVIGSEAFSWSFCIRNMQLAEGSFVLESKDDKIYMVYSGGGVTGGNYEVGMLTARKGSNLLDSSSWSNSPRAWMNNGSPVSQVGPGHNSFVRDEYGDLYNVYHSGHRPRHTSVCPVHFRFDGSPVIDMAPYEEVNPTLKQVEMHVCLTSLPK